MANTKHFYRLEHKDSKIGVYNVYPKDEDRESWMSVADVAQEVSKIKPSWERNPPPTRDGLGEHVGGGFFGDSVADSRFGFSSLTKMKNWFSRKSSFYKTVKRYDIVLALYEIDGERFDSQKQSVAYLGAMKNRTVLPFSKLGIDGLE